LHTILFVAAVWPEPNSSAAGRYILSLAEHFKRLGAERIVFASAAQHSLWQQDLDDLGYEAHAIELNSSSFDSFVAELSPCAVVFDRFMTEEQYSWRVEEACPSALRLLDLEDLQSLRASRHEACKRGREWSLKDMRDSELALREVAAILRSDFSFVISKYEYDLLINEFNVDSSKVLYLPFSVRPNEVLKPALSERNHFIAIGNFRHAPNWDSVLELVRIWPRIRSLCPGAELHIFGAYMPPKAKALENPKKGLYLRGWADDALSEIASSRVLLAPLRFGAGLKGKLLEAMMCGTPSVTTPIGSEGMSRGNWPGAIAENDDDFVEQAVQLFNSDQYWASRVKYCDSALDEFNEDSNFERLRGFVERWNSEREGLRAHSFVGRMLRLNLHRSQKYMSQWIEEKTKNATDD